MIECNQCKKHVPKHRYKYCPECGSKMVPKAPKVGTVSDCEEDWWEQLSVFSDIINEKHV
jgi:predicted amidophosphoribosyltransferase